MCLRHCDQHAVVREFQFSAIQRSYVISVTVHLPATGHAARGNSEKSDKDEEADEVNQSVDSKDAVMMHFEVAGLWVSRRSMLSVTEL